ncbi:hypothetical protein SLS62_009163 [Diatrype stigma]|uniref:Uncharacterized protein n=1 Tax=Diatrype stigma TaxID=117547 RepID=A0AAN9YJ97_9PEZI
MASSQPSPQRPSAGPSPGSGNLNPSMKAGRLRTGVMGTVFGAGAGIMRGTAPALFALVAGLQWFSLGSTYIASKGLISRAWGGEENLRQSDFVKASGVAGGVSGMVGGMFRGPKNIIPGMLLFSMLGAGGSFITQRSRNNESKPKPKTSWLDSKWIPLQRLSDKDYEEKLEEKILRLDAEIAIIDEHIAALKATKEPATESITNPTSSTRK